MDKIALNAMDRHGVMTDIPKGIRDLRTNPNSYLPLQQGKKPSLRDITLRAYNKMPLQSRLDSKDIQRYIEPLKSGKADFNKLGKTASADYEEVVKTAYEEITGDFEKKAANALGKNLQQRPGAMHSEFMRRGVSAGHASDLINDYRGAVSGQRRMEGIMGKHNMSTIYPESIDKVHDSLRRVGSAMRTPASIAQGASLQKTNARRMQHLMPSVKTAYEDIVEGFAKEAVDFDKLNKETWRHNNGISRNISPTPSGRPGSGSRMKASDLLANFNNYTYKQNNGAYPDRLYR